MPPSKTAMAASLASSVSLSREALPRCLMASGSGGVAAKGKVVPELPESGFLILGDYAVGHAVVDAEFPAFPQCLVDGVFVAVGDLRHGGQCEPQVAFVEVPGPGGIGGELDHLVPAGLVGPAAFGVFAAEDAGLLAAEGAGAGGGFQEVGEGHGFPLLDYESVLSDLAC